MLKKQLFRQRDGGSGPSPAKAVTAKKEEQSGGLDGGRCHSCGRKIEGKPVISGQDNHTHICADCGIREALGRYKRFGVY